jgi:hypothetical protein
LLFEREGTNGVRRDTENQHVEKSKKRVMRKRMNKDYQETVYDQVYSKRVRFSNLGERIAGEGGYLHTDRREQGMNFDKARTRTNDNDDEGTEDR